MDENETVSVYFYLHGGASINAKMSLKMVSECVDDFVKGKWHPKEGSSFMSCRVSEADRPCVVLLKNNVVGIQWFPIDKNEKSEQQKLRELSEKYLKLAIQDAQKGDEWKGGEA